MTSTAASTVIERVLGSYGTHGTGRPLLIVVGGIHGNEPGGVLAAQEVIRSLAARRPAIAGRVVFLSGNRQALEAGTRFLEVDLNRIWSPDRIEALRTRPAENDRPEERELRELHSEIERELAAADGRVVFLDLHSTSANGAPFAIIGDTLANRDIAFVLGIPVILGLEENIGGTLLEYFGNLGHVAVGFEGGQHEAPTTRAHDEAAIWITLVSAGLMQAIDVPDHAGHVARLARVGQDLPRVVEILHRHGISPEDDFRMHPGYVNFQPVAEGELLAYAEPGHREVRAPRGGMILMPLYQAKGREGFFLARTVRPFWLALSALLRRAGLDALFTHLPGLRRRPGEAGVLEVDARIARFFTVEIFHLLGYRRCEAEGNRMVFTRRVEGLARR